MPPSVLGSETVVPLGAEGTHHLIIGRFPVLGFLIPDLLNGSPLVVGNGDALNLLHPVAGILPVASCVLLDPLPQCGNVDRDGDGVGVGHLGSPCG